MRFPLTEKIGRRMGSDRPAIVRQLANDGRAGMVLNQHNDRTHSSRQARLASRFGRVTRQRMHGPGMMLGVYMSLDDLAPDILRSYLTRFAWNELKIDRSFVGEA